MKRRTLIMASGLLAFSRAAAAAPVLRVAYAGSMGVVMDRGLIPGFAQRSGAEVQGIGQGSYALARLLDAGALQADVFVAITPGPIRLLLKSGKADRAAPVAGTEMVIAYAKGGRFASDFVTRPWWQVLETPGLRFGRTDPVTDPQGRNIIFTLELAEIFYGQPGLASRILGETLNPAQIFTEPSLLSRLEAGQLDAASGYRSACVSAGLPFVTLPREINLGDATLQNAWYARASLQLNGRTLRPEPLVFYAAVLRDAAQPDLAKEFVAYLAGPDGQAVFANAGYGRPSGGFLTTS